MTLGQFFLARSNQALLRLFKPRQVQKVHKTIACCAIGIIILHPVLIVLPRAHEGGIKPWDAFITMITDFGNLGIVLGLVAWGLLAGPGVTVFFRKALFPISATGIVAGGISTTVSQFRTPFWPYVIP